MPVLESVKILYQNIDLIFYAHIELWCLFYWFISGACLSAFIASDLVSSVLTEWLVGNNVSDMIYFVSSAT